MGVARCVKACTAFDVLASSWCATSTHEKMRPQAILGPHNFFQFVLQVFGIVRCQQPRPNGCIWPSTLVYRYWFRNIDHTAERSADVQSQELALLSAGKK